MSYTITTITTTIAVTGGLPVIVPAEIFTDVNRVKCSTNLSVGLSGSARLSPDTQLVSVFLLGIVLNLSGFLPGVDLQLGRLPRVCRGWRGRDGARGHLVAPRHHRGGPGAEGGRGAGLPARAEGDVARSVRHQRTQGQRASAGGQVGPRGLRAAGSGAVDLVSHVTLQGRNILVLSLSIELSL